jgi:hypothetical protein
MKTLPKDDLKKQPILEEVMNYFEEGEEFNEVLLNDILKNMDLDDYVMFRRELVNFGYLERDAHKGLYWVRKKKLSEDDLKKIAEMNLPK